MNISLPDDIKAWADAQVKARSFASLSEFVRDLLRRQMEIAEFRAKIEEGLASPLSDQSTEDWLESLQTRLEKSG